MKQAKPKQHIDVYVDGCWLNTGKSNPLETGGWGAVVVESENNEIQTRWHASGGLTETSRKTLDAEYTAVLRGIEAVKTRQEYRADGFAPTEIVIHTDQIDLAGIIEKTLSNKDAVISNPILKRILPLIENNMRIEYTKASKGGNIAGNTGDFMEMAHHLASAEAHQTRFIEQGFLGRPGIGKLPPEAAKDLISRLQKRGWNTEKEGITR